MKKFIKNNIKTFVTVLITTIIVGSISVYAASQYFAKDISFTPTNENFKKENGESIDNVEDAINALYNKSGLKIDLLWTNNNPSVAFTQYSLDINLKNYKYIILSGYDLYSNNHLFYSICKINDSDNCFFGLGYGRTYEASSDNIEFSKGAQTNIGYNDLYGIPFKIYGVKDLIFD